MKSVTQEELMGCGIACVAFVLNISYKKAKNYFEHSEYSKTRGFYCKELVQALRKAKKSYDYSKFKNQKIPDNSIVFLRRSKKYPAGHYLVKSNNKWMNSWINFPSLNPVKAGFHNKLFEEIQWIIYPINI